MSNDSLFANASTGLQWIDCNNGQPVAGATSQSFAATTPGTYAVIVTDGACSDTSECFELGVSRT